MTDDDFVVVTMWIGLPIILVLFLLMLWDEGRRSDKERDRHKKSGHMYIKYAGEKHGRWCTYSATAGHWVGVIESVE
jgi:hypothetical protein